MRASSGVISRRRSWLALAVIGIAITATTAYGQQPANWTGAIRCDLQSTAPGYSHQESQTWTLTGAAPTTQGSVTVYPATWSVSAQGSHDRTRNASRRIAQWTASVPGPNAAPSAPIGFTRHAVGGLFDVAKWHAQLTVGGGYTGTDQFINDGVPQSATRLVATVYEWQFPKIEAALTQTQLTGSHTMSTRAQVGPLQPEDANVTITCSWSLARGSAPPLPPSAVPQPSSPISSGPATNPPPAAAPATTAPPAVAAAPPVTTPSSPPPAVATATPAPVTPPASATPPPSSSTPSSTPAAAPPSASAPATTPPAASAPATAPAPSAPPAATSTSVAPPAPPPATSTSKVVNIEIYAHFVTDSTVPFTSWWPPNGKARYVVGVDNTPSIGSGAADGTMLRIPASAGLSKTGVACVAQGGAQCPAGLTVAQLENGVAIPRLPAFSYIRVAFEAQVTATLGSSVTVTATVTKPPNTRDTSAYDDTVTKTHAILTPSTDTNANSPLAPVRANVPQPSTPATSSLPSIAQCILAGPVLATPAVSHIGTSLTWPHINGARYTVSRDDVGLVTTSPLTSSLFPSTLAFSHSAPMYYNQTYRYSVRADYGGGCGISTVTVVPPRPPSIWADARRRGETLVDLLWEAWFSNSGGGGVRVFGPGMPADGLDGGCQLTIIGFYMWCNTSVGVGPGDHSWLVVPYWETENGIMIDVGSGTRVRVTVP